ncbi:alpha/beta hydrolase [Glutamicibacter halophytocola]|uniref:Alpha/beta hydrolase n=2 Tax=Glutamicibacter halophytocola TaxID=1933880 RepID=A0ABX5Y5C2_9MICC|nr:MULTISPECIES: alpha/beta hydrolase [Glutamicibacter]MBF6671738.1 alpha/beta hydrolase [Glutamicibacter sp. FBE19]NQD40041.1 alpha/beta hydrolase [Glutamicibacter halophytocola]QDY65288.1 alpha/beta hydrolase [Glutamicibacter halophytocola]
MSSIQDMKEHIIRESDAWPDYLASTRAGEWSQDLLGESFECQSLDFGVDDEGPAVATLVRYRPGGIRNKLGRNARGIVLSVHGWSDYFYNQELAFFWHSQGYHFYAVDLRRHGRSLRSEHQLPGYVDDLAVFDEDLDAALSVIQSEHPALPIVAQGHSTGGLILSLWIARKSPGIAALVLNSPWLEFQGTAFLRIPMHGLMEAITRTNPRRKLIGPEFDHYWQSLSAQAHGEWDVHRLWRPRLAFPNTAGWLKAIFDGHAHVAKGMDLRLPILVMTSDKTHIGTSYSPDMQHCDSVLDVQQTRLRAGKLGSFVTLCEVPGAMHDVFTSAEPARATAYRDLALWLRLVGKIRK